MDLNYARRGSSEPRRRADVAWSRLTRKPVHVERRRIRGTDLPANRRGRVAPPRPPDDWEPCVWCSFYGDPFHDDESCKRVPL
jgi:hypothetical protein